MPSLGQRISAAQGSLLLACTLVIMPFFIHLPIWIGIVSLGFILWRALYDFGYHTLPNKWLRLLLVFLSLAGIIVQYKTPLGRQPGASMVIMLMCLKLLELHDSRDERVVLYLGFFIVAVGFLFNQSLWMGLYLVTVTFILSLSLMLLSHQAAREINSFTLIRPHARRLGRMSLQALPIILLLFVFFPRLSSPLWGLPQDAYSASTGLSDSMSPGDINQLSQNHNVAFRAQFEAAPPPANQLYWRAAVLNRYDGWQWLPAHPRHVPLDSRTLVPLSPVLNYSIMMEPQPRNWLFVLDRAMGQPSFGTLDSLDQLRAPESIKQTTRYRLQAVLQYRDTSTPPDKTDLLLPSNTAPRAVTLAHEWRAQSHRTSDIVNRALAYFRDEKFYYTLQPPLLFDDPVDEFLFETRKGYCEHYASAFTVLMRAAGIPARVVIGYQGGEYNTVDNYFVVRQSDAHAWSEVWYPQRGWQRVDPTAVIPLNRVERNPVQLRLRPTAQQQAQQSFLQKWTSSSRFYLDALNYRWKRWVIGYNQKRQASLYDDFRWDRLGPNSLSILMLVLFSLAVAAILIPWSSLRRPPRDPVNKLYRRFCQKMARLGIPCQAWEGAEEYAQRILHQRPELARPVRRITWLYQHLRYARLSNQHNLLELEDLVNNL